MGAQATQVTRVSVRSVLCPVGLSSPAGPLFGAAGPNGYICWVEFQQLGCPVLTHNKPRNHSSRAEYASNGCHIGTSMEHHHFFNVYSKDTRSTRVTGVAFFKHKYLIDLVISPEDLVVATSQQRTSALQGNVPGSNHQMDALEKVAELFEDIAADKSQAAREDEMENNGI